MSAKLQRYRPTPDAQMLADEAGGWVKFEGVAALSTLAPSAAVAVKALTAFIDAVQDDDYRHFVDGKSGALIVARDNLSALASPSAEAAQPVAMDWPHLVQLGRCLGLFASGIKAVGEWSKFYQSEYDKANLALQEVFKELAQVEGACLRIEMVSQAMRKGDPSSGLLNEAVATIRAALAGRTAG
jgi:hypothetical protein